MTIRPGQEWTNLRDAAVTAARRGWALVPGTYPLLRTREWMGRDGAAGLCPVYSDWQGSRITEPGLALTEWTRRPFGVLLICGYGVDAVELPARLADQPLHVVLSSPGLAGPVLVLPPDRMLLLVATGEVNAQLDRWSSITYRGLGQWVPLPPTDLGAAHARWEVPPPSDHVDLPESAAVQRAVLDALGDRIC